MALVVPIRPDTERRIRDEAQAEGVSPERLAARRLEEAELLWRIRSAAPESETRELHRLLRKRGAGALSDMEEARLAGLLNEREIRAAERLMDLVRLSELSRTPLRALMDQLGITPIPSH